MPPKLPIEFTRIFRGNRQLCGNRVQIEDANGNPISYSNPSISAIKAADSPSIDAFGRLRVSEPYTIFDSKQINNEHETFYWDDQQVSGGGTTSTYLTNRASTVLGVALNTAGLRVRQTKQRFNYQPGKSQMSFITFVLGEAQSGITREVGLFDAQNGIFLRQTESGLALVVRSYVTGAAVDSVVNQANWNLDILNGSGDSGYALDQTKAQILFIDYEWLGVGRVRVGFVFDGIPYYAHQFLHSNIISYVYTSRPNLPVRYSIENDGTGAAATFETICSSVNSEGGFQPIGVMQVDGTRSATVNANVAGTYYAILGIRLKSTCLCSTVIIEAVNIVVTTVGDEVCWELRLNPTVAGAFAYANKTNSVVQTVVGDTVANPSTNTVTLGTVIASGYASNNTLAQTVSIANGVHLGSSISGTPDSLVLCVAPVTGAANIDVAGIMTWREVI